jgi:hypothetical protein
MVTSKRFLVRVGLDVAREVGLLGEALAAIVAGVRLLARVRPQV